MSVGARAKQSADEFAKKYQIPRSYGSYLEVATDPEVQIIYVSTIHPTHYDCCKLALSHRKHVICEVLVLKISKLSNVNSQKPLTLNALESQELVDLARKNGVYFQEASTS